jgi:hypothetical protein
VLESTDTDGRRDKTTSLRLTKSIKGEEKEMGRGGKSLFLSFP